MTTLHARRTAASSIPRGLLVAAATLVLSSCRSLPTDALLVEPPAAVTGTGAPARVQLSDGAAEAAAAQPQTPASAPPAVAAQAAAFAAGEVEPAAMIVPCFPRVPAACGWPNGCQDPSCNAGCQSCAAVDMLQPREYICDGGDRQLAVRVERDWTVRGLDQEDTVVHYDTLSGETVVQPSNRVCVYAPRFAAVRRIDGLVQQQHRQLVDGMALATGPAAQNDRWSASAVSQPLQLQRDLGVKGAYNYRVREGGAGLENSQLLLLARRLALAEEQAGAIERRVFEGEDRAHLDKLVQYPVIGTHETFVEVLINGLPALEVASDQNLQALVVYESQPGEPRLCVLKTVSRREAQPGDTIEFAIRFENVGTDPIGNVTVLDNLATRFEYIPDSASCSIAAEFSTQENEGGSLVLRWEISDPMEIGDVGEIHFRCLVR